MYGEKAMWGHNEKATICKPGKWKWKKVKVAQSCPTLCNPMDYTVHGILQARVLEGVAFPFSRGSSQPRDQTQVSHNAGRFFTNWAIREAQECWSGQPSPPPWDLPDPGIEPGSPALQVDSLPTELWSQEETSKETWSASTLILALPASGTLRKTLINFCLSHSVCAIFYRSPSKIIYSQFTSFL